MKFPWQRVLDLDHWKFFGLLLFALAIFWMVPSEHRNSLAALIVGAGGGWVAGRNTAGKE